MSKLVLKISHWHAAIKALDRKAMSEQMRMDTVPVLTRFILVFNLLQAGSGGNAIENILDLSRGDMPKVKTIIW